MTGVDSLLFSNGEFRSAALWGLGGSGKTQIALDYAHRRCIDPLCSVFWVHADNETTFVQGYKTISRKLDLSGQLSGKELLLAVRYRIETLRHWVLIVDNADDLSLFGVSQAQVEHSSLLSYVPTGFGGTVLWTSRDEQILGTLVSVKRALHVPNMTITQATALLQSVMGQTSNAADPGDTQDLVKELHLLPLLISQAGAYMRRTLTPIRVYLSQLLSEKERWSLLSKTEYDRYRREDVSNSLLQALAISIKRIRQENESAYNAICILSYLDNQNIPEEVITASAVFNAANDEDKTSRIERAMDALSQLLDLLLISRRKTGSAERAFEMHKLVQEATRYGLHNGYFGTPGDENDFARAAISVMLNLFPAYKRHDVHNRAQYEPILSHAIKVAACAELCGGQADVSILLARVSEFLRDRESWWEKESVDTRLLSLRSETLGMQHPDTLTAMQSLVMTYLGQGRYQEAEKLGADTLRSSRNVLGETHLSTVSSMDVLVAVYVAQGRFQEAEAMQRRVLSLRQDELGGRNADTITALSSLARTRHLQGQYKIAEEYASLALELRRECLGEKHPDTISTLLTLADIYESQGRYKSAERAKLNVVELREEVLGEKHPGAIIAQYTLAITYNSQGRYREAENITLQVLGLQQKVLGEKHPDTIKIMGSLAYTYTAQGRYKEAETIQVQVLELRREILSEKHPDTIMAMDSLAYTYNAQGRHKEAETIYMQVLELQQEVLSQNHPDTFRTIGSLAYTFSAQGRHKEAETIRIQVLELQREFLGEQHPNTIRAISNLANTYSDQGRHKEAETINMQVLELLQKILGDKHLDTIRAMGNLADTYSAQGQHKEAETINVQVLELLQEILGDKHPDTIRAMGNLADTYSAQGQHKEAETILVQVLELRREVLGDKHPDTIKAIGNLAYVYSAQG